MAIITLYKGTVGLNTQLDPKSIQSNAEGDNLIELSQAVNINIDDRGLCSLRNGSVKEIDGNFHSLFCKGLNCFVAQENISDASIMQVLTDFSLVEIQTGLTKNLRIAWDQSGEDVFYSNGNQKGYIKDSTAYSWSINTYQGTTADLQFATSIPSPNHIAFQRGGKILIAVENAIFCNHSAFQYGLFEISHGNIAAFESDVTMLASVQDGFFASDNRRTWFFRQTENWYQYKQELVEDASALEWSLAYDQVILSQIGFNVPGFGRIWVSTNGICLGMDNGNFINLTESRVKYPTAYMFGASLIKQNSVIHTAW